MENTMKLLLAVVALYVALCHAEESETYHRL